MKVNWILAAALACASSMGATVTVQAGDDYRVFSISDARSAATRQDESASDVQPPAENEIKAEGEEGEEPAEEEEECPRCYIFNQERTIKAHGWVNGGIFTNSRNTASRYNGPVTFADRNDGQINQLYGILEKPIDTSETCWDIGGRLDVLYGTDWVYNTEAGWEASRAGVLLDGWNSSPYYGLVTPQAYGEVGYGDLSLKVGRFYTPIGYEVVTAPNNFFATHAYTMQYGEPFSHTGALGTYKASDNWTFLGGLVNGWDRFDGLSDRIGGLGGAIYTPDHGKYTLTLTGITGSDPTFDNAAAYTTRNLYSLVFSYNITDNLNYVFQHDNGWQQDTINGAGTPGGQNAEWYGINQYLFYTINDCWKAGIRAEWFRDDDGVRVAGVRPSTPTDAGNASGFGQTGATPGPYVGNFYEVSVGLNWTPHSNVIIRPEVRYDWFEGAGDPFGDGTANSQWLGGFDAIVLW